MQVIIQISLKDGVLDPEGRAIAHSLNTLGFDDANSVRIGKSITLDIDTDDPARARQRAARMCEVLLANTVIEDYEIQVSDTS